MGIKLLTEIAESGLIAVSHAKLPRQYSVRSVAANDADILGLLHFTAYGPTISPNLEASVKEMEDMYRGDFGELWLAASPLVYQQGELVGAALTVYTAPWKDTPICPFIIDLMVSPDHRRAGLATYLLYVVASKALAARQTHISLRVREDNRPALRLYHRLGFVEWEGDVCARGEGK